MKEQLDRISGERDRNRKGFDIDRENLSASGGAQRGISDMSGKWRVEYACSRIDDDVNGDDV